MNSYMIQAGTNTLYTKNTRSKAGDMDEAGDYGKKQTIFLTVLSHAEKFRSKTPV